MWKTLTSLAIWGPGGGGGGFNNQTGPILVHIYPLFYINLHIKYRSNMIFGVMLGPYIKSRASGPPKCQQMQPSSQWRHMYNKGKQFENHFLYIMWLCKIWHSLNTCLGGGGRLQS